MEEKKDIVRMTFDVPAQLYKALRIKAAYEDKSMREIVVKVLKEKLRHIRTESQNVPQK